VDGVTNTATNVILVQHSIWNERQTAGHPDRGAIFTDGKNDWSYINDPDILIYVKLDDGNHPYGAKPLRGSNIPNYKNPDTHYLLEAIDPQNPNVHARELWVLTKEIVDDDTCHPVCPHKRCVIWVLTHIIPIFSDCFLRSILYNNNGIQSR
jgi:hypothetical protein